MSKISFIQTGGTIDKDYPHLQKGWAFEIAGPAVQRVLEKLKPNFAYEVIPLLQKDSLEITAQDRQLLLGTCHSLANTQIIITHGTDTLLETASYLRDVPNKTIVLTGAMRPEQFSNSDAPINVGMAIAAVQTLPAGTYIAIQGLISPWQHLKRDASNGKFFLT